MRQITPLQADGQVLSNPALPRSTSPVNFIRHRLFLVQTPATEPGKLVRWDCGPAIGTTNRGKRVAEYQSPSQISLQGYPSAPVISVECTRIGKFLQGNEVTKRNKIAAARGTYINILQAGRGTLRITLTFGYHIVRNVFIYSGRYPAGAGHRFQGPADYTDGHTHFRRTMIIDVHLHLGFSFLILSATVDQAGIIRFDLLQEDVPPLCQRLIGADADDELPRFFNSLPEPLRTGRAPPASLPRPGVVGSSR